MRHYIIICCATVILSFRKDRSGDLSLPDAERDKTYKKHKFQNNCAFHWGRALAIAIGAAELCAADV